MGKKEENVMSLCFCSGRHELIAFGCRHPKEPVRIAKIIDKKVEIIELMTEEKATVCRVSWNITGFSSNKISGFLKFFAKKTIYFCVECLFVVHL